MKKGGVKLKHPSLNKKKSSSVLPCLMFASNFFWEWIRRGEGEAGYKESLNEGGALKPSSPPQMWYI